MFTYHPVDVTSHPCVFISVFRQSKCCALRNNMYYVFCLIAHSAVTINWLLQCCSSDDNEFSTVVVVVNKSTVECF